MSIGPYDTSVTEALNALRSQLGAGVMFDKALKTSSRACNGLRRRAFEAAGERATASEDIDQITTEFIPVLSFAERAMFNTAWNSGRIDAALAAMIDRRRLMAEIGRKVRAGMIQPVFVLFVAGFAINLPALFKPQGAISIEEYLLRSSMPLAIGLFVWFAGRTFARWRARQLASRGMSEPPAPPTLIDRVILYLPLVGYTDRMRNLAEFSALLASLTHAGVQTREAFAMLARAMPNGLYRRDLDRIREATVEGNTIASAMTPGILWPEELINIIEVAETAGDLDVAMERQARQYLDKYSESIRMWGVFIARGAYVLVCLFVIYHIMKLAGAYVGMIQNAADGKFPDL
jgi:type II secretory pathway component PulF